MDFNSGAELQNRPEVEYPIDYDASLNGVGGWLVLVIIGRIFSIILGIKDISDSSSAFGFTPTFDVLLTAGIIIDIVFAIIFSVLILVFMFSRNILFRTLLVVQVSVVFIFNIIVIIYVNSLGFSFGAAQIIGSIIGGVIWILYLYKSKRVKNTYIYPKQYPHLY